MARETTPRTGRSSRRTNPEHEKNMTFHDIPGSPSAASPSRHRSPVRFRHTNHSNHGYTARYKGAGR